jgi:hypothetical protein
VLLSSLGANEPIAKSPLLDDIDEPDVRKEMRYLCRINICATRKLASGCLAAPVVEAFSQALIGDERR